MTTYTRPLALIATIGSLASIAVADAEYEFFLVPSFNPNYALAETYVLDINENNVAIGTDTFGGFTWTEATGKVQLPINGPRSINNLGYIAFSIEIYDTSTGTFTPIPSPSAQFPNVNPRQINDNMVLVGVASHGGPSCEPLNCPFDCGSSLVWTAGSGSSHIGNVPGLKPLFRVNNSNVAVGMIITGCDNNRAIVYDLDTGEWVNLSNFLPPVALLGIPAQTWPADISDAGHVIGEAIFGAEPAQEFIWTEADGFTFLPAIPGGDVAYMSAASVNVHGHVVGAALDEDAGQWKAFVWDETTGIRDLNQLATLPPNFILNYANRINDNGWIVGSGHFGPGWATQRGFVLKPVAPAACLGDFNADGAIDGADLGELLAAWGRCGAACAADLNADGVVDGADLGILLAAWGSCPQ